MKPLRAARRLLNRYRGEARVDGIRLPLDYDVLSANMERTLAKGRYEWGEARYGSRVVSPGDIVLELGAGIGFVSSYIRRHSPAGRIICVEAHPQLIPYIKNVHAINEIRDTTVLHGVVQIEPKDTSVPFYCRRDFWASSLDAHTGPFDSVVKVPSLNFTELLATHEPNVLIMDIEGGELDLLSVGALGTVRAIVLRYTRTSTVSRALRIYSSVCGAWDSPRTRMVPDALCIHS